MSMGLSRAQLAALARCDGQLRSAAELGASLATMRALWRREIVEWVRGPGADGMPLLANRYRITPHGSWVRWKLEEAARGSR